MLRGAIGGPVVCMALLIGVLAGCGYVGNPLPPALMRPMRVSDLAAVQRGSNIIVQFTIPKLTTEGMPISGHQDIELRIGVPPSPFNMETWLRTSERVPDFPQDSPIARVPIPAEKYYGQTVDIAVNMHGPKGQNVGWSAFQIVPVVQALQKPGGLKLSDAPDSVHLEWLGAAPDFRIFRKLVASPNWEQIGTSPKNSYNDATIEYGKTYEYFVQADEKTGPSTFSESDLSDVATIKPTDTFPPAVPSNLTAIPGARTIELVWDRNQEKDFANYRVYRNGQQIAQDLTSPSYTDSDVRPGTKYQYQVSAVDTAGNASAKSSPAEATIP
jgi:hypothetical protein